MSSDLLGNTYNVSEIVLDNTHNVSEIVVGKDGDPGQPGKSAYEIAVLNGFEGSEQEWLASLQGPPGESTQRGEGFPTHDAPIGTVYVDTLQTNGALQWIKGAEGWQVTVGDTGKRRIDFEVFWDLSNADLIVSCYMFYNRVGSVANFEIIATIHTRIQEEHTVMAYMTPEGLPLTSAGELFSSLGFVKQQALYGEIAMTNNFVLISHEIEDSGTTNAQRSRTVYGEGMIPVSSPWPEVLPGTPA